MTHGDRFTRDDLQTTTVQVEALRHDLDAYRDAIEQALHRRNIALFVAAVGVVLVFALQTVGGWVILTHEAQRDEMLREVTRLQACQQTAELRADLVVVLSEMDERRFGPAVEIVAPDVCTPNGENDG